MANETFSRLRVAGWRQFDQVDIDLTSRLTVLTGANGTGKTSLLALLARHFNWSSLFVGKPSRDENGRPVYDTDLRVDRPELRDRNFSILGDLTYSSSKASRIAVQRGNQATYDITILNQQRVPGLYLTSHRSLSSYKRVESIPAVFTATDQILEQYINEIRQRFSGGFSQKSQMFLMKEALLAAAVFGEGNSSVRPNDEAAAIWEGFQRTISLLLPESLKFERLIAQPPDILIETGTGSFAIDAVSGGVGALLELAWQVFLRSREFDDFTVCLDEPENHLHPSLQRDIMPSLLTAFPNVSFVVATHSPFVVTSFRDANVYVLDYNATGGVSAFLLDFADKSASADETLRDVLGLSTTLPVWAENAYDEIMERYIGATPTADLLRQLKAELDGVGLKSELPSAISHVLQSSEGEGRTNE